MTKPRLRTAHLRGTVLVSALLVLVAAAVHADDRPKRRKAGKGPLKVYILAGQSNMQGHAHVRTFEHVGMDPETAPLLRAMRAADGTPRTCKDVWITSLSQGGVKEGRLTAGFGASEEKIGPEFTFGIRLEEVLGEPVLLIKTAWGGKSLHTDFRPPSAGPYVFRPEQLAALEKRGRDPAKVKAEKAEATGHYYRLMLEHVRAVLADPKQHHPAYNRKRGYELAGFVWFQGWNDMVDSGTYPDRGKPGGYDDYSRLLTQFIRDVRKDLEAPALPFVIGVMGVGGPTATYGPKQQRVARIHDGFRAAMAAPASRPEFRGSVVAVRTERYWDSELSSLRERDDAIQQAVRKLKAERTLSPAEVRELTEARRAEAFTEAERETLRAGISNQAFHYLGSAKILGRIGVAFADAFFGEPAAPPRSPSTPSTTTHSADHPDFTQGGSIPAGATHDWNLGPTGARGWMYSHKLETSEARQVFVTQVEDRSPAAKVLRPGDVILGVGDTPFAGDPRTALGMAIGAAEADDGKLALLRWRGGNTKTVVIRLEKLGAYAPTAPFDCRKSRRILEDGCKALAKQLEATPDAGNPITRSLAALALLASGKRRYLPVVRREVARAATYTDPDRKQLHSWFYGPVNLLLAEYTLATGDKRYKPALERITMEIVRGQSAVGSWGHRFVQSNGRLAGYGMMNAPGLPLVISLVLAREAGVADPALDAAIAKTARLVRFYVGKGSVPYGDHHPWIETHDDNGKNGAAAVLFDLLGDAEASTFFSRMSVAAHGAARDTGHTGNYFNILWALPGVARAGPHATGAWMQTFGWYFDLARRWDGTFLHQGPPEKKPDKYRNWDATGAFLLAYAQSLRKLRITGRGARAATQVDASAAAGLIDDGRGWSPRRKLAAFADRGESALFAGLSSWSPVLRERSAIELARRGGDVAPRLVALLGGADGHARLGACQALEHLGPRGASAVPALRKTLHADELWLRVKAADALAAIGKAAAPAVPDLLTLLARPGVEGDPRGMLQRYLCFALFDRRKGLLGTSLEGVDREALYAAVREGLQNEDGRARGALGSVYANLGYEELEPLLPAIHRAVAEPAPSGIMFADGIRLRGLEILAKHRIREGLALWLDVLGPDRWGLKNRVKPCLAALRLYGGAARGEVERLRALEKQLAAKGWKPKELDALGIPALIRAIEGDAKAPALRPLPE